MEILHHLVVIIHLIQILRPLVFGLGNRPFYFNRRTSADNEYNCMDFMSWNVGNPYTHVATFGYAIIEWVLGQRMPTKMLHVSQDGLFGTNLTVSGTLQSSNYKFIFK